MRALNALARRGLTARPLRTALTILGIGLGIGILVAALVLNASMDAAARRTVSATMGRATLRVGAVAETGLGDDTLAALGATAGVTAVAPELERRTYPEVRPAGGPALPAPVTVLGVDPAADLAVHDRPLQTGSALPADVADGALVSAALAREDGLAVGSTITLNGSADAQPAAFHVVGVMTDQGGEEDSAGRVVVVPLAAARTLFAAAGVTRVDLALEAGADPATVVAAVEHALTAEPYTLDTAEGLVQALRDTTAALRVTIALVAAVALFGGAFLIFNTLAMTVAERARELGLLRAAGMTRRQVVTLVLISSMHLGAASLLVGLVAGVGLAALGVALLPAAGVTAAPALDLQPLPIAAGIGLGLAVVVAAALEPALRAGRISPVEALTARLDQATLVTARRWWLLVVFAVVGVAGLALWPGALSTPAGILRPLGLYGFLVVLSLVVPVVAGALARAVTVPFRAFLPVEARLTRGVLARDRSRTTLTVAALVGALSVLVAIAGVTSMTRRAATAWLVEVVPGDELLSSIRPLALDEPVFDDLRAAAGVARVSPIGRFAMAANGMRLDAAAVSGGDLAADGRLSMVVGDRAAALAALDAGGAVILSSTVADRMRLGVGGTLTAITAHGSVPLQVVGIAARTIPGTSAESILVGWSDATGRLGALGADVVAVRFTPDASADVRLALNQLALTSALEPESLDAASGAIGATVDALAGLFSAFALVALLVAALGIVNTSAMNVAERRRELAVLRAAGLTRRQAWRLVVLEATILGIVGAILGGIGGIGASALFVLLGVGPSIAIDVPWSQAGLAAVIGIGLAIVAAAYPARMAARAPIIASLGLE